MLIEFLVYGRARGSFRGGREPGYTRVVHHYPEFSLALSPTSSASDEMAQINHREPDGKRRREKKKMVLLADRQQKLPPLKNTSTALDSEARSFYVSH